MDSLAIHGFVSSYFIIFFIEIVFRFSISYNGLCYFCYMKTVVTSFRNSSDTNEWISINLSVFQSGSYHNHLDRRLLLTRKLLNQGFLVRLVVKLKSSLRKFYYRHHDLVKRYKWPRICSVCSNHNPVLSSFMTYHRICHKSNTMNVTLREGTAYPPGAPEFTPVFSGVRVTRSSVFCVLFR